MLGRALGLGTFTLWEFGQVVNVPLARVLW
jgi:hypothetical protein